MRCRITALKFDIDMNLQGNHVRSVVVSYVEIRRKIMHIIFSMKLY